MVSKKTFEINPKNKIIIELKKKADADNTDRTVKDLIWMLYETSLLTSGFNLEEPQDFAGRINRMIKFALSLDDDENVDEVPEVKETNENVETTKMESID